MTDLSAHLASLPADALHTVLHVGAGDGSDLDAYRALAPQRLILVEGDPDTAELLGDAARDLSGSEIHSAVLAPTAGLLAWNRYNLRFLNGPLDASGLARLFPRLRRLGTTRLDAQAIGDFIESLALTPPGEGKSLLVLDVPGQEHALLEALQPRLASRFDAILIRSARPGLLPGSEPGDTDRLLQSLHYRSAPADDADDPLWTTRLWRFDRQAAERAGYAARIAALETDLATARAESAAHKARLDQLAKAHDQLKAEAPGQQAELHAARQSVIAAKAQIETLIKARDEQAKLAADRAAKLDQALQARAAADKAASEAKAQIEALAKSRDEQAKLAADRAAKLDQALQARAAADKAASEAKAQIEALAKSRDEQVKLAQSRATQIATLTREAHSLSQAMEDADYRHQAMQMELQKAEAQIGLIKDLMREPAA
jgi:hypothetical protein